MPRINIDGLGLHVEVAGSGPPLVLLHGFSGSGETWTTLADEWSIWYTTIAVDLVGHGRSDTPAEGERYHMSRVVTDLVSLLHMLGYERAAWLGYSLGGRTTLQMAVRHPEAVAALVLEGASAGIANAAERKARVRSDETLAARIERDGVAMFVDGWERLPLFATQATLPVDVRTAIRSARLANSARGLANSLRGMGAGVQEPLHDRLNEVRAPTLLLAGALDVKYAAIATEMAQKLPNATMHLIDGAGHAAHLERREQFSRPMLDFLGRTYREVEATAQT